MLQARIGRLEQGARRAVRAAALFGQTFWRGGVAYLLGMPGDSHEVEKWLAAAVSAEVIQPHSQSRVANDREYGFRHAMAREAAYHLLTATDLATGHRMAGEFLERIGADAAIIAEHYERSGDKGRAASGYLRAAESRLERGNNQDALRQIERGLANDPSFELEGQLRSIESFARFWLDRYDGLGEIAERAMAGTPPGSLGWCRAFAPAFLAAMLKRDTRRGFELLAAGLAVEPDPDARAVFALSLVSIQALIIGMVPLAKLHGIHDKLRSVLAQEEASNPTLSRYLFASQAHTALFREPRPWKTVTEYGRALDLGMQAGDEKFDLAISGGYIEWGWLELGDAENVRQRLLALSERMEPSQEVLAVALWRYLLARALCESSEAAHWDHAEQLARSLLSHAGGHTWFRLYAQCILARVAFLRGRLHDVAEPTRVVMPFLPFVPMHVSQCASVQLRALSSLGAHHQAYRLAERVLAALRDVGSYGHLEVEFRLAASESFLAAGNRERAHAELRETLRQIRLRAEDIPDPFWKNSYLTRNAYCARAQALAAEWGLCS
jgi:tetratricopeptide (TPR) repeat protein